MAVTRTWSRGDVQLGQLWERGGELYRVAGLIDDPVVVLVPLGEPDDSRERAHHVIGSPLFAEFGRLDRRDPDGAVVPAEARRCP